MTYYYDEPYLEEWEYPEEETYEWEYLEGQVTSSYAFDGGYLPAKGLPVTAVLVVSAILVLALGSLKTGTALLAPAEAPVEQAASPQPELGAAGVLAPLFTPQVQAWSQSILEWAEAWHMDPNLIATVMQIESCGDPQAVSSAGAMGLFQVMPFHFAAGEDGHDPQTNARRGLAYLQNALDARGGEVRLAFAGYNAGINGAKRPENLWPAETLRYVYWGVGIYSDAREGKDHSPYLQEWLDRGGSRLCEQAGRRLGLAP
jgi:soluble lytic murein transglycosylase-like protein